MKEEKQRPKVTKKEVEIMNKKSNQKRFDYLVTYAAEGAKSRRQKTSAYSEEEAKEIVSKKLNGQIERGEINGFKILSVEIDDKK
jgi:hypothetical protein